jgi:poly-gamma-glutamate synthesis protein (capsule biosynthesis protein)
MLLIYTLKFSPKIKQSSETTIILAGDVMLGRTVMTKSLNSNNPSYPFEKVSDELNKADIVFVNLENPIVSNCPRSFKGLIFCTDPAMTEGLVTAGINIVNLANNHSRNYGENGLSETVEILDEKEISITGLGKMIVKESKGIKYGFLGFDFISRIPRENDYELVAESVGEVDVLIVGVHWGAEYKREPAEIQKQWAKELVEAGADVIVGHGPHWVQGMEYINEKPVYYSLGNFIFDQMWSEETKTGLVMKLTFRNGELIKEEELPTYMSSWAQPEFIR